MRFLLVLAIGLMPALAFAETPAVVDPTVPPEWLHALLLWVVNTFPTAGTVITEVMKWIGVLASVATLLSYVVQGVLLIPEIAARWSGANEFADKFKYWSDKIIYWLKYFSIRNVEKKNIQ